MTKIIAIEGLDGVGKSTQIKLLIEYLNSQNISYEFKHFPEVSTKFFGELISKFLRGEFGQAKDVDPYLVAMLYAGDRFNSLDFLSNSQEENKIILLDRYVYSNIAFQCAKVSSDEKEKLREWIYELEFKFFNLPKPTKSILLNVPFDFTVEQLKKQRVGSERDYLKGKEDIHESDLNLQENVLKEYLSMADTYDDFFKIDCTDENYNMLSPELIHKKVMNIIKNEL